MTGVPPLFLACSVLVREVQAIARDRWPGAEVASENSMLHMQPVKLSRRLWDRGAELGRDRPTVLVYGDCCPDMAELAQRPGVARTPCMNCFDLVLGRAEYRRLSRDGAFFLLPEWAERWPEIFQRELGFSGDDAAAMMGELHRKLVYLDTGLAPRPQGAIEACAAFAGLPWEVERVSPEPLAAAMAAAVARARGEAS